MSFADASAERALASAFTLADFDACAATAALSGAAEDFAAIVAGLTNLAAEGEMGTDEEGGAPDASV